jgi:small ligand-binding sensory domain FIST
MTITAAHGNVIEELASKPAIERLREAIGELDPENQSLVAQGLMLGIVIDENQPAYERGDFLVRPILGADPEKGTLALGERVRIGQTVRMHVRDGATADEDLRSALRAQAQALGADGAAGALLFTCNGRGSHMFETPDHDALALEDALGAPAGGFFCAGEIGPVGGRNFLHGFTATIAVFPRD